MMNRQIRESAGSARVRGFTLLETLVMLVLVSFAMTLMFQSLGMFRHVYARVSEHQRDSRAGILLEAWLTESVRGGVVVDESDVLQGDSRHLELHSLNALENHPGTPRRIDWTFSQQDRDWVLRYHSEAGDAWSVLWPGLKDIKIRYLGSDGKQQDQWPPKLGLVTQLPRAVIFTLTMDSGPRVIIAPIEGDLTFRPEPFQAED